MPIETTRVSRLFSGESAWEKKHAKNSTKFHRHNVTKITMSATYVTKIRFSYYIHKLSICLKNLDEISAISWRRTRFQAPFRSDYFQILVASRRFACRHISRGNYRSARKHARISRRRCAIIFESGQRNRVLPLNGPRNYDDQLTND